MRLRRWWQRIRLPRPATATAVADLSSSACDGIATAAASSLPATISGALRRGRQRRADPSPLRLGGASPKWQCPRLLLHQREVRSATATDPAASRRLYLVPGSANPISVLIYMDAYRKRQVSRSERLNHQDDSCPDSVMLAGR